MRISSRYNPCNVMPCLPRKQSTRKRKFVDSYIESLNATKAALAAGYSASHAGNMGCLLLKKPDVQAAIAARLNESGLTQARVLREIERLAFADPGALYDETGKLLPIHKLPENVRAAIASVKVLKTNLVSGNGAREEVHEVKQWDKVKALEMAAKYLKLLDGDRGDTNVTIQVSWMNNSEPKPNEVTNITPETQNPLTE